MADAIIQSAAIAAILPVVGRGTNAVPSTADSGAASQADTTAARAAPLSSGLSQGAVGATTGAALGAQTLASVVGLQGAETGGTTATGTADATTGSETAATATTDGTTTTEETETTVRNGQIVRVTRTVQIDANGVRTVISQSSRVVYGTTLATLAYQNAQSLTTGDGGTVLGIG